MAARRGSVRRLAGGMAVAALVGVAFAVAQGAPVSAAPNGGQAPGQAQKKPPKPSAVTKANEPWPDAKQTAERRVQAENLPLFKSHEPLAFTLTAAFGAINRDRDPNTKKVFPGVLQLQGEGGKAESFPVQLSTRGHARLNARVCSVVPLRVEFTKKDLAGTVFERQRELKLVTNCENDSAYEQYVLTEYLAYRIFGLFTPRSFRARLVKATYVDPGKNKTPTARYGMFIEHDDDVARRLEGRIFPFPNRLFKMLDQDTLMLMTLLQFMVGNTDYSILALHNIKLVRTEAGTMYPITYDFDYSGLVNASYAAVDRRLNLSSVRERLFRGPCRTAEELEPFLATFRAKKNDVLALIDAVPDFSQSSRQNAREYLEEFFSLVGNPGRVNRSLVKTCTAAASM